MAWCKTMNLFQDLILLRLMVLLSTYYILRLPIICPWSRLSTISDLMSIDVIPDHHAFYGIIRSILIRIWWKISFGAYMFSGALIAWVPLPFTFFPLCHVLLPLYPARASCALSSAFCPLPFSPCPLIAAPALCPLPLSPCASYFCSLIKILALITIPGLNSTRGPLVNTGPFCSRYVHIFFGYWFRF